MLRLRGSREYGCGCGPVKVDVHAQILTGYGYLFKSGGLRAQVIAQMRCNRYKELMDILCRAGSRQTEVTFISRIAEVPCGDKPRELYVFDDHTRGLFPCSPENCLVLPSGEQNKQLPSVEKIIAKALECGLGRDACFVAVGGGVICDMTAFAAAVFMRGVPVILIPTTLLSMVDASLGGKSGVDFNGLKNLIGAFHPAERVIICSEFTASLSDREFLNGFAEVIKHGLLSGGPLYAALKQQGEAVRVRDREVIGSLIYESLLVKKRYIEEDPYETEGTRLLLNLGHTFGHALETVYGLDTISHGEAVAWGMHKALKAGFAAGFTEEGYFREVEELLRAYGYPIDLEVPDMELFFQALRHDKKNREGRVQFILQRSLSDTFVGELPTDLVSQTVGR